MSKILVVEAHRMLQQAIALALFPEYEVMIVSAIPESSALKGFDTVIVDPESLGESAGGSEAAIRTLQSLNIPTIWMRGSNLGPTPQRQNLVPIKTPIDKETLLAALAECLGVLSREIRLEKVAGSSTAGDNRSGAAAATPDSGVIDLFEVVDEGAEVETGQVQEKN